MNSLGSNPLGRRRGPKDVAEANRATLRRAGVTAVSVVGGLGCGKTTLIARTVEQLMPRIHAGLVACDAADSRDWDRVRSITEQVLRVNRGDAAGFIDARTLQDAIQWLDLDWLDVLFIEHAGPATADDAGEPVRGAMVAMFSVPAGHEAAAKHPELVRSADLILLNKVDLQAVMPFDLTSFKADVARLNPRAEVIELCATGSAGVDRWLEWLRPRLARNVKRSAGHGLGDAGALLATHRPQYPGGNGATALGIEDKPARKPA